MARADFLAQAPQLLQTAQQELFAEAKARTTSNIRDDLKTWDDVAAYFGADDEEIFKGWARVSWARPTGAPLEDVGDRLRKLKLTIRNAPLQQPASFGKCIFTGQSAVEEILIARAY
jgi:prolyl-tRNA synthetase